MVNFHHNTRHKWQKWHSNLQTHFDRLHFDIVAKHRKCGKHMIIISIWENELNILRLTKKPSKSFQHDLWMRRNYRNLETNGRMLILGLSLIRIKLNPQIIYMRTYSLCFRCLSQSFLNPSAMLFSFHIHWHLFAHPQSVLFQSLKFSIIHQTLQWICKAELLRIDSKEINKR